MIGGKFSDKLAIKRKQVRMEVEYWGLLLGAPFIYMMAVGESKLMCYTGMALFGLFRGIYDSNLFAALFDVIEPKYRASSIGIMLAFAFLIGALAPVILGWVKTVAGLEIGLASLSLFYLTGAILIFTALKLFFKQNYYEETHL
jgi:MFS family permease